VAGARGAAALGDEPRQRRPNSVVARAQKHRFRGQVEHDDSLRVHRRLDETGRRPGLDVRELARGHVAEARLPVQHNHADARCRACN
jgi:hypothetical protein